MFFDDRKRLLLSSIIKRSARTLKEKKFKLLKNHHGSCIDQVQLRHF